MNKVCQLHVCHSFILFLVHESPADIFESYWPASGPILILDLKWLTLCWYICKIFKSVQLTTQKITRTNLGTPYFHCCWFQWVIMAFPSIPGNSSSISCRVFCVIKSVQVWILTIIIPPGSNGEFCAVANRIIIIFVFRCEHFSWMSCHVITYE